MKNILTLIILFCNSCFAQTKIEGKLTSFPGTRYSMVTDQSVGFPRYALVNKSGKLVTISAPAPQFQLAYDLIQKCLNE